MLIVYRDDRALKLDQVEGDLSHSRDLFQLDVVSEVIENEGTVLEGLLRLGKMLIQIGLGYNLLVASVCQVIDCVSYPLREHMPP